MPDLASIAAIIVTYHPNIDQLQCTISALSRNATKIVIVDNGSAEIDWSIFNDKDEHHKIIIKSLGSNIGLAAAQNLGIKILESEGIQYCIFLDQDTIPGETMIPSLLEAWDKLITQGIKVAAISPIYTDSRDQHQYRVVRAPIVTFPKPESYSLNNFIEADFLISSGTFTSLEVLHEIGYMNEGYFIDHIDTEWCLRAKSNGWRLFNIRNVEMRHTLGENVVRFWFLRWRHISIHSPLRNYYMARNTVFLLLSREASFYWRIYHLVRLLQILTFFPIFIPPRLERIKFMLLGLYHGIINKSGKFKP